MSTISQYTFTSTYNADKLTKRQVVEMGISSYKIDAADTDSNGELSFEEIVSNQTLCDDIVKIMNAAKTTVPSATEDTQPEAQEVGQSVSYEA